MPSPLCSLVLATSLWVPSGTPAQQPATTVPTKAEVATPAKSSTARKTATKAKTAGAKVPTKPGSAKSATAVKAKPTPADCDLPASKAAAAKPVPVAADPLAPTLAPCAEPPQKP